MKPHAKMTLVFAALALTLAGCCPKQGDGGQRLTDTSIGAKAIESEVTTREGVLADSSGMRVDIVSIDKPTGDGSGGISIRTRFQINDDIREVSTDHFNPTYGYNTYSVGDATMGGYQVHFTSACSNSACTQYYILAELATAGVKQLEFGLKYNYADSSDRWYTIRGRGNFHVNFNSFVSFMNDSSNH